MGKLLKTYLMPHPPIMIEEIGKGNEKEIKNTIEAVQIAAEEIEKLKPDTIVIIVPPHGPAFSNGNSINTDKKLVGNLGNFRAPQVKFDYDVDFELIEIIMKKSVESNIPIIPVNQDATSRYKVSNKLDHGSMVPLYFINKKNTVFKVVHITYGILPKEELYHFGKIIRESIEESNKNAVIISSGDLSHRLTLDAPAGFAEQGEKFDEMLVNYLKTPETEKIMSMDRDLVEAAGECGYRSILIMLGSLDGFEVKGNVLSYEGPFGVGYCTASYEMLKKNKEEERVDEFYLKRKDRIWGIRSIEDEYVKLARESLESYIKTGDKLKVPNSISEEMLNRRAGVFVSLKKDGELRGCIGTIQGTQNSIAKEIIENAISSGIRDPRFYPIEEDELDSLVYSVDVLGEAEEIETKKDLDPKKYGVIVKRGRQSGLLLPNLEGIDTIDEQLKVVLKKAGINENEDYSLERFEVIRHK